MTNPFRTAITILLYALLVGCAGAGVSTTLVPESWNADRSEILSKLRGSSDAWNQGDLDGHLAIYVDSVSFMTDEGPRPGVDRVKDSFSRSYWRNGQPIQRLDFEQITIRPLGEDAALLTGRFILSGGGRPDQSGWYTLVWIRTDQGWRAVHDHSS